MEMETKEAKFDAIVIGAGVVGPAIATAFAREGRKVLLIERDWSRPDRIVGELMQPAGIKALKELGMVQALNNIDAIYHTGYYIKYFNRSVTLDYIDKEQANKTNPVRPVPFCVFDGNDKLLSDRTLDAKDWDESEKVRGIAFHHGDFLMNLRLIACREPNVTKCEGTAVRLIRHDVELDLVLGVEVKQSQGIQKYYAKQTICCDGIYSKFRKEMSPNNIPSIGSYFVGLTLKNANLPAPHRGHCILGDHAPVLVYQISPEETRILCAYRSVKPPSQTNNELINYLRDEVLVALPEGIRPSFDEALKEGKFRAMPNQYLPAMKQKNNRGLIFLGDSLNMRHPLTGGGMTVGLNDASLLAKLLLSKFVTDFEDYDLVIKRLSVFHRKRKNLDGVINTLSIALYSLFAADKTPLKILQNGCFNYFLRGGECIEGPIGLLSGMLPFPMMLFNHFFSVAFYAIYCNFCERGWTGFPIAIYEAISTLFTAVVIFTPYLWAELFC